MSDKAKQSEEKILRGESLTISDISGLSNYERRILRNVNFAKYGRKYEKNVDLNTYFNSRPWYKPHDDYNDNLLTQVDKDNIKLIYENENGVANSNTGGYQPSSTPSSSSRTELNREIVLSLLRGRINKVVAAHMHTCSWIASYPNQTEIYSQMIAEKIITCRPDPPSRGYCGCVPGPKGGPLGVGSGDLSFAVGYKSPTEVTGISKIDQTSAMADFLLTYKQTGSLGSLNKYSSIFWFDNTQSEQHKGFFRLYDDGWRLENWR
jgi:hypothetical protein